MFRGSKRIVWVNEIFKRSVWLEEHPRFPEKQHWVIDKAEPTISGRWMSDFEVSKSKTRAFSWRVDGVSGLL